MENYLWIIGSLIAGIIAVFFGANRKRKLSEAKRVQLENLRRDQSEQANVLSEREKMREETAKVAHAQVEERLTGQPIEPTISDATIALQKLERLKKKNGK